VIKPAKGGMVTNGGCRCKPHQLKREIYIARKEKKDLLDELEECDCMGEVSKLLRQYGR